MASITLSRPSRKGNLANVVAPTTVNIELTVAEKGGRKRKEKVENEGEYRGTNSVARTLRG
jgi:hypothetical protein